MFENTKITFIGSGAMATAMIAGLCEQGLVAPHHITASDPFAAQLEKIEQRFSIKTSPRNVEAVKGADIIVLAVKPQTLAAIGKELKNEIPPEALVLSILAGSTINTISQALRHDRLVRVMPNTPAQVNKGMSVWTCTEQVDDLQKQQTQAILGALGAEIFVDSEKFLDMATALSGGGPAYVYLFMEALIDAGVHMGFARPVAQQLVYQTLEGSVAFARSTGSHPAELRNMVTSPGGTTAEALYQLEKGGFRAVISKAIWAACQKSRYLGGLEDNE
ncbi:MAG: pyrroline-5-carboxylate reductase [Anaerolineae bacterium]|nr:pyrroline-5-carboxylate reductase [Anaerolineae bacterium]